MTYWLICNSRAGDGERGRDFWLHHLAEAGIRDPECCDFEAPDWHRNLGGEDTVIVAGGDGSVSRVAAVCREKGATMAVLPSGTANDFARNLALPEQPGALCELIATGATQTVDVADYGQGIFLNVAHIGIGTLPVRESGGTEKKIFGRFSYAVELLRRLNARRGFRATIRCDKGVVKGRWLSIAVASGAFFGGGNEIPGASVNDGQLNVIAVRPRPLSQLLLTFLMVRLNRRAPQRTSTLIHLKGTHCKVNTAKPKTVTADGDVVSRTPLDVCSRSGELRVIGSTVINTAAAPDDGDGLSGKV
ncbi:diacylglycerol/lipid kinase family protein [Marinobacter sp. F3R08]|uniref:diacylglycerol/lipid kinase family protein n=1 Tax=Marinobacter sp. F3R08 TaxID=2841559 RepID=UPI001C0A1532|nr:diacylglycerol kinase family protein [Marinobacter sp. F3R08]MBU2953826.1 diacylglycerol kinase family lipid kinase [Marinobacter sp. F3R08]